MEPSPAISEELKQFLESGIAIMMGVRDGQLQPDGAWAWAARVHDDGRHLTVFLYEDAARQMLPLLEEHPQIALAFDAPTTHRACQVKGAVIRSRRGTETERALVDGQVDGFYKELEAIGIPRAVTTGWKTWPCIALELRVTHLFEQTPGPGTGGPLR